MKGSKVQAKYQIISLLIIVCGAVYIFAYQFKLPFRADLMLAVMAVGLVVMTCLKKRISLPKQAFFYFCVDFAAAVGLAYTTMRTEGIREVILFVLYTAFFVLSASNISLIHGFLRAFLCFSVVVVVSSVVQYLIPNAFNDFMKPILREEAYSQLMWSYTVDNAYAGIAAYTPYTSFFAAIVCGHSFLNILQKKKMKETATNVFLVVLSLYSIILCSKRGVFVATIAAMILVYCYLNQRHDLLLRLAIIAAASVVVLLVLYQVNDVVAAFVNRFIMGDFLTGRGDIYSELLTDFWNGNVLLGRGTGATYALAETGAHNIYLQILYDHGLVLCVPYYAWLLCNYYVAFKNKCPLSIFVQTIFLVYGLSGNPLYSNMFMIMYVYYVLYAVKMPVIRAYDAAR